VALIGMINPTCGPHSNHAGFEAADMIARPAVTTDFIIDVTDEADLKLLGQELRRAPIEMHVDAVLILGRLIGRIVGEAEHAGEFVAGLLIEIRVAEPGIDRAVPDADIRQPGRVVGSDRYIPRDIDHVVVDARVPAQRELRDHVSETPHRVAEAVGAHEWEAPEWSGQCA
jgi:hypothetical protein